MIMRNIKDFRAYENMFCAGSHPSFAKTCLRLLLFRPIPVSVVGRDSVSERLRRRYAPPPNGDLGLAVLAVMSPSDAAEVQVRPPKLTLTQHKLAQCGLNQVAGPSSGRVRKVYTEKS